MAYIAKNLVMRPLTGMGAVAAPSSQCTPPQLYVPYYDSCVNPCPAGQQYDPSNTTGLCQPIPPTVAFGLTGDQLVLIGGAALAAWFIFGSKKKKRNPGREAGRGDRVTIGPDDEYTVDIGDDVRISSTGEVGQLTRRRVGSRGDDRVTVRVRGRSVSAKASGVKPA